jgi:hypothetical protein
MITKSFLHLFFALAFFSCALKSKNDAALGTLSIATDRSFEAFFKQFSTDSIFQESRIVFPLRHTFYDVYEDTLTSATINANDWTFIDFRKDSLAVSLKEDAFNIEINKKDSLNVDYLRKGIDNGISMTYSFEKRDSRWYLIDIIDDSN